MKNTVIVKDLKKSNNEAEIMSTFEKYQITSNLDKYQLLQDAMGNPITYSTQNISEDDLVNEEIAVFLDRSWELNEALVKLKR